MAHREDVAVPEVFGQWSGRRVLTMEWADGCRVTDVGSLREQGLALRDVAVLLLDVFAEQQFVTGYAPSPGERNWGHHHLWGMH